MAKPHVFVAIPNTGCVASDLLDTWVTLATDPRFRMTMCRPQRVPCENCRNFAVKQFLETDATHLLQIDADNPPLRNPLDLVRLDLDILICPTPMFSATPQRVFAGLKPIQWNVFDHDAEKGAWKPSEPAGGLQEVDAGGTGCILIARRVLESLEAPFQRTWRPDGTVDTGSDLEFCRRAKEAGFRVWAHWEYLCDHYQTVRLGLILDAYVCPEEAKT